MRFYNRCSQYARSCVILFAMLVPASLSAAGGTARTGVFKLSDPFPKQQMTKVAELTYQIENPNAGNGSTWVYDNQLPFTGTSKWGKDAEKGARAWATVDAAAGFIDVVVEKAHGNAYARAYTPDLPRSGNVEGKPAGFRGMVAVSIWGPSPNGKEQPQSPGLLGLIIWENQGSAEWKAERWEWPGSSPKRTQIAGGDGPLDFNNLRQYVGQIANGRPVGYYEVSAEANSSSRSEDGYVHARLVFRPALVTPSLIPHAPSVTPNLSK